MARRLQHLNAADGAAGIALSRGGRVSPKVTDPRRPLSTGHHKATPSASPADTPLSSPRHVHRRVASSPMQTLKPAAAAADPSCSGNMRPLVWDGEESKRKSLTVSCVSLQSLKLGPAAADSPTMAKQTSAPAAWRLSGGLSGSDKGKLNANSNFLSATFTRGRSGTGSSAEGEPLSRSRSLSWSKKEGAAVLSRPSSVSGLGSGATAGGGSPRNVSAGGGLIHSSSDDSCNSSSSHSEEDLEEGAQTRQDPPSSRSSGSGAHATKKLNLHKLLQKVDSREAAADQQGYAADLLLAALAQRDPDQQEMGKRIKKCLTVSLIVLKSSRTVSD